MVRDGQLLPAAAVATRRRSKLDLIPGVVLANAEGYGFLRPDAGGDDLYLSPRQMRKVLHGDRVLASVVGVDRRGRKQGAIVEVLQRRSPRLVGRVVIENGVMLVAPDDRRLHQDIMIVPGQDMGARSGQIVVAEITEPPTPHRGPIGAIRAVLGERLQPSLLVEMAIASHDLPHEWPDDGDARSGSGRARGKRGGIARADGSACAAAGHHRRRRRARLRRRRVCRAASWWRLPPGGGHR